ITGGRITATSSPRKTHPTKRAARLCCGRSRAASRSASGPVARIGGPGRRSSGALAPRGWTTPAPGNCCARSPWPAWSRPSATAPPAARVRIDGARASPETDELADPVAALLAEAGPPDPLADLLVQECQEQMVALVRRLRTVATSQRTRQLLDAWLDGAEDSP